MPNSDYILRSDALKAIRYENWRAENRTPSIEELHLTEYQLLAEAINNIPAADVEPKRKPGRWVGMQEYCQHLFDTTGERYTMSQLGIYLPHCNQCWEGNESRTAFCPHCGAKMFPEPPKEEENGN